MFEQEKDGSEEPETGRPEPKLVPLGFFILLRTRIRSGHRPIPQCREVCSS